MPLSDLQIRKAKSADKPLKLFDEHGLFLLLRPDGARWWRWNYSRPGTGKRNTLSMGTYPTVTLAEARDKRDSARKQLAHGIDPGEHRKATKATLIEQAANSFEVVAREWFAKQNWSDGHAKNIMDRLEKYLFPYIGARPIDNLTAKELLATLNRIVERGRVETAHRVLQYCVRIYQYANATARTEKNPAINLQGALPSAKEKHRAAIIDPATFGGLLRAIDGYTGQLTRWAMQVQALTFVRPGELRQAEWTEFDLDAAEWNIPASRMKMKEPHLVPLSAQAVAILREVQLLTGTGRYVFPSGRSPRRPMSNNAVLAALRRMGVAQDEMSGHGFRATARTLLDEVLHFRVDLIEHQLAHAVRDPNGRAYNRTKFLAERRKMMQAWADYLDKLKKPADNVVPFVAKAAS
jgi:integrase